jgi:hypothetical protein
MVYNTRNFQVFGLCPSPGILKTRENVSETDFKIVVIPNVFLLSQ